MFLKLLLLSVIILALSFAGLGLRILLLKNGKFPAYTIGKNKEMHKRGITCPRHDELKKCQQLNKGSDCTC